MKHLISIMLTTISSIAVANCEIHLLRGDYEKAIQSAKKITSSENKDNSTLFCLARSYFESGRFSLAADQFLYLADIVKTDEEKRTAYQGIGMSMLYTGDYNQGIEYLEKKLIIDKEVGDENQVGVSLATMAAILGNLGQHQEAIKKSEEALNYLKRNTDISSTYNNIANEYSSMNDFDNAIKYMKKAILLDRKFLGDKKDLSIHLINISHFYLSKKEDRKAIKNLNEGIKLIKKEGDLYWLMTGLSFRSKAYFYTGELEKSKNDINQALTIAENIKPREIENIRSLHTALTNAINEAKTK